MRYKEVPIWNNSGVKVDSVVLKEEGTSIAGRRGLRMSDGSFYKGAGL